MANYELYPVCSNNSCTHTQTKNPYLINTQLIWALLKSLLKTSSLVVSSQPASHQISQFFGIKSVFHSSLVVAMGFFKNFSSAFKNKTQFGNWYSPTAQFSNNLYFIPVLIQFIQQCPLMYCTKCDYHMDMQSRKMLKNSTFDHTCADEILVTDKCIIQSILW